jgi:hypothetical protein
MAKRPSRGRNRPILPPQASATARAAVAKAPPLHPPYGGGYGVTKPPVASVSIPSPSLAAISSAPHLVDTFPVSTSDVIAKPVPEISVPTGEGPGLTPTAPKGTKSSYTG